VVTAEVAQLVVDDTVGALGLAGRVARSRIAAPVIGVTGSAGKTSTKDLLASILTCAGSVAASERSLNNEMGVPLTLLNASEGVARAVVEMGARGEGHIAYLCEIAKPTIAVVTNVAGAHLELFGSIEAVARAKGELVESLDADGIAVLNNADPNVASMAGRCVGSVIGYSAIARVHACLTLGSDRIAPVSAWAPQRFERPRRSGRSAVHRGNTGTGGERLRQYLAVAVADGIAPHERGRIRAQRCLQREPFLDASRP
jgi:UDP-N-acetylmuramyl pentapeptide synthase